MKDDLTNIVDLDRYPLNDRESGRYSDLVERCREALDHEGCCRLENFFTDDAVAAFGALARDVEPWAHLRTELAGIYGGDNDASYPDSHPRRHRAARGGGFVAADRIDRASALRRFYEAPSTTDFIAAAFGHDKLHRYADPLASMAINSMRDGDQFPWHFDTNEITISIMLTAPQAGGEFEYVPNLRAPDDEHYDDVSAVINGDRSNVQVVELRPGDIQLFRGRYALHRVTTVRGATTRNVALPSWSTQPDQIGVLERAIHSYGRALPIHYERARHSPDHLAH